MITAREARPGPAVTWPAAEPGEVRNDTNGIQWYLDGPRGWQPVVFPPAPGYRGPAAEAEAG